MEKRKKRKKNAVLRALLRVTLAIAALYASAVWFLYYGSETAYAVYRGDTFCGYLSVDSAYADGCIADRTMTVYKTRKPAGKPYLSDAAAKLLFYTAADSDSVPGYRIYADGLWIASAATEEVIREALSYADTAAFSAYTGKGTCCRETEVTWEKEWVSKASLMDTDALQSFFCEEQENGYVLSYTYTETETGAELLPFDTVWNAKEEDDKSVSSLVSVGADGMALITRAVTRDLRTDTVLSETEQVRNLVTAPVSAVRTILSSADVWRAERQEERRNTGEAAEDPSFIWPLPDLNAEQIVSDPTVREPIYISSKFGYREINGVSEFHLGLDIAAPRATEIYACADGIVVAAKYMSSYGYMVRILHDNEIETVYAHMEKFTVKAGDSVSAGTLIGYVGTTGNSSGYHLHMEFRRNHVTCDPDEFLTIPDNVLYYGS